MKSVKLIAVILGSASSAGAFTVDFSAFAIGDVLDPEIVVNVLGYGDVRFSEAPLNTTGEEEFTPSELEITDQHANGEGIIRNSIGFIDGEQMLVTFEGIDVFNVNFDYAGIGVGEQFNFNSIVDESGPFLVSFSGNGGGIVAVSFDVIPEPSSSLLISLAALGLIARRQR